MSFWEVVSQIGKILPFKKQADLRVISLCLIAATTFWFFSALNKNDYNTKIEYPIKFAYKADSTILLSKLPETITLDVSGGGWSLLRKTFLFNSEPVLVNLEEPTKTKSILGRDLAPAVSEQLGDLKLNAVDTDSILINIESLTKKIVRLAVNPSQIKLEQNHRITSPISIVPDTASISGPETYINAASDTIRVALPNEVISENFNEELPLTLKAPDYVEINPTEVEVNFTVEHFSLQTAKVKADLINFPEDSSLSVSNNEVTVSFWIADQYLTENDSVQLNLIADLDKMNTRDSTIVPDLIFYPEHATDIILKPAELRVVHAKKE